MKILNTIRTFCLFFAVFALSISSGFSVNAQDKPNDKTGAADKVMDPMMQKWMEYATPNENHKVLEQLVGSWDHTVSWKMAPDAKPEESKGTSDIEMIMGGRYLQHKVQGTFMGQPFEGMGFIGYDNAKKHYDMIWFDNMGTGMMKAFANYYPNRKMFVEYGKYIDPIWGKRVFRGIMKLNSNDNFGYEMYVTGPGGEEFQMMEIIYTRKK